MISTSMIDPLLQQELRSRFNPDGSPLRRHQLLMLDMLKKINRICVENNIKYWLSSAHVSVRFVTEDLYLGTTMLIWRCWRKILKTPPCDALLNRRAIRVKIRDTA